MYSHGHMAVLGTCVSWVTGRETNVCRIIAASKLVLRWEGTKDHPVGPSIITKILACGREMTVLTGMVLNVEERPWPRPGHWAAFRSRERQDNL